MRDDLLGQFDITPQGYTAITRVLVKLADELCKGRIGFGIERRRPHED